MERGGEREGRERRGVSGGRRGKVVDREGSVCEEEGYIYIYIYICVTVLAPTLLRTFPKCIFSYRYVARALPSMINFLLFSYD